MRPTAAAPLMLAFALCACSHAVGGAQGGSLVRPSPPEPVAAPQADNYGRILLPEGATVVVESDQTGYAPALAYERNTAPAINGVDAPRLKDAFPIELARRLRRKVRVVEAVHPDDLASDGLSRWSTTPPGDVAIISYGLNEATREDDPIPAADFARAMQALSDRARSRGGWVVLMPPPPYPEKSLNAALEPYRAVVRAMAEQPHTLLFDSARVLAATPKAYASKRRLGDAGQKAVGDALSALFLVVPRRS
ncbi:MAG: hypothetical protein INR64_06875 [Caulobacteraceae bacterium]|nr:hypothetical protein [Caulobacter sp.]